MQYFVGCVPKSSQHRENVWSTFVPSAKQRYAILLDTGAPSSCVGKIFAERFIKTFGLTEWTRWHKHKASLSGIGSGSATSDWIAEIPVGLETVGDAFWKAQILEGIGAEVPPLMGLDTMVEREGVIDLRDPTRERKRFAFHLNGEDSSRHVMSIFRVSGHIVLPIDWGGTSLPDKQAFVTDPLGLSVYLTEEEQNQTNQQNTAETETARAEYNVGAENFNNFPEQETNQQLSTLGAVPVPAQLFSENETKAVHDHQTPMPATAAHVCVTPMPATETDKLQLKTQHNSEDLRNTLLLASAASCPVAHELRQVTQQKVIPPEPYQIKPPNKPTTWYNIERPPGLPSPNHVNETNNQTLNAAQYGIVKQLRKSTKQLQTILNNNKTYQTKYRGLPAGTAVPPIDLKFTKHAAWDFWEWWAGEAVLSHTGEKLGVRVGPPITWTTGWCLKLNAHQQALKHLLSVYKPWLLFGAPTCSPWSTACTTLQKEVKEVVR